MPGGQLVSAEELAGLLAEGCALVFDCRFDLLHPELGRNSWLAAHIPGAVYAHLDEDLSGRVTAHSGRHPLPAAHSFAAYLARSGWDPEKKIVAYDAHGGAIAARLWWLVRYFGLGDASLLDGGIGAWMAEGLPLESGPVEVERTAAPELSPVSHMAVSTDEILQGMESGEMLLLDVRSAERFSGRAEPIDPVAGHIPGAVNHPLESNLREGNRFKSPEELQAAYRPLLGKRDPSCAVAMCGSGVTACQALFAMDVAGLEGGRLYAGSWSEWIRDPRRPIVQGDPRH